MALLGRPFTLSLGLVPYVRRPISDQIQFILSSDRRNSRKKEEKQQKKKGNTYRLIGLKASCSGLAPYVRRPISDRSAYVN